ncbi:MAG: calcium-translocating P-type ATPase, PMCA-type [Muribaculaceae bacterium]|nr:calcium-translocating P-type ATPase, PMCA-type [Muribaculaceae bacterium]
MEKHHFGGLSQEEVIKSREQNGVNILTPPEKTSLWVQFLEKFKDPLIRILLVALVLSVGISAYEAFWLGHDMSVFLEPLGIFVAVMLATVVGFIVEVNANKKFQLLNQVNDDIQVKVVRDGKITEVPRKEIVVGDVVLLETGEEVPADGELLDSMMLSINESTLTGEPMINKTHKPEDAKNKEKEVTYPSNHVMRGTTVMEGHGVMRVFAVGDSTEYGKVYTEAQIEDNRKTPLFEQFDRLGKVISVMSYVVAGIILVGRFAMYDYSAEIFTADFLNYAMSTIMLAVTLIVVSVPEGLPMSVTLSLALSMRRMLKANNLVRKMHACETMGATDIICTDKTGTLTQNQMSVREAHFFSLGEKSALGDSLMSKVIAECIACNSTAYLDVSNPEKAKALGNPTEGALLLWLRENGVDYLPVREGVKVVEQLPFSTERKYMATIVESKAIGKRVLYVKGAPEILIKMSKTIAEGVAVADIEKMLAGFQAKAMRTLGFAYQVLEDGDAAIENRKVVANRLELIGVTAIADPVRSDVPAAINDCLGAGIDVKIVTGDTVGTACEIGRQVGLWKEDDTRERNHISGPDFAALDDKEAQKRAQEIKIMSRARPSDKSRLVNLLQDAGHVVAVTGDGTNDAPALNAAQVGLSMGDGTSVAKEASDITILDNSFASISKAVMWGRSLYKNIQRFILFQITVNVVACAIVAMGAFMSYQSPLTVTQMLWVNLIMDTFAALSFASLPASMSVMKDRPRKHNDFIITKAMWKYIFGVGLLFIVALFGLLQYFKNAEIVSMTDFSIVDYFRSYFDFNYTSADSLTTVECTMFFTIFVFLQFWSLFNVKCFDSVEGIFSKLGESKIFFTSLLVIFVGQVLIVQFGGKMFSVEALSVTDWVYMVAGTSVVFWAGLVIRAISPFLKK